MSPPSQSPSSSSPTKLEKEDIPYPFNLGTYTRSITTTSSLTQTWFDRGLLWTYAFNHEEALRCFERAHNFDPQAIMPLWGLAYALGPNYNKPWEAFGEGEGAEHLRRARAALTEAEGKSGTEVEKGLVEALRCRYPLDHEEGGEKDHPQWNQNYAKAMQSLYHKHLTSSGEGEEDPDLAALTADSLMNLHPWSLWDIHTNAPTPGAHTLEIKSIISKALSTPLGTSHPGLLHLYTHLMEMSPSPESALPQANLLRNLCPDAGHLQHMPTHLDVLCGDWERAIESNSQAILADQKFSSFSPKGQDLFYTLYRAHNLHFKIYAALFAGKFSIALETARLLEEILPEELLRIQEPPMADWLESFMSLKIHVLIRFGKWEDLLQIPIPQDEELYCVTTATRHYGRGMAFSNLDDLDSAAQEKSQFEMSREKMPSSRTLFNNSAKDILSIASSMLEGEFLYRSEDVEAAFESLRLAIKQCDELPYDEPWGWMQPPRHAYGALLLEQGRVEEAKEVYAADLGFVETLPRALRHAGNVWALHGFCECRRLLGERDEGLEGELRGLAGRADVTVGASCFCRRRGEEEEEEEGM